MSIATTGEVIPSALWPQGDIRDPLGVWGVRQGVTGDASGGSIKVEFQVPASQRSAYVYTCYGVTFAQLTGAPNPALTKIRLLTNWPDVDNIAGVQGFATLRVAEVKNDADFSAPIEGLTGNPISNTERFMLLFDPRPLNLPLTIVELEHGGNVNTATYSFEGYGYFWDRSVLNAPGGPRHPGSS